MQVDPIKPTLKAHVIKRLKLKFDELLSDFAFNFNLRHYIKCHAPELHPSCHPLHTPKKPRGACDYCRSWRCTICRAPTQLADLRFDPFMAGPSPSQLQDNTITGGGGGGGGGGTEEGGGEEEEEEDGEEKEEEGRRSRRRWRRTRRITSWACLTECLCVKWRCGLTTCDSYCVVFSNLRRRF
jgi:hypothetical protein